MTGRATWRGVAAVLVALALAARAGQELWVDNARGDDAHPGTREQPLATLQVAVKKLTPGTTLHLVPNPLPYAGDVDLLASGTAEAPIVVEGHGSTISGRGQLPAEAWTPVGGDVFCRPLPNNAWGMETHWEGGFPLVWFDGQPARHATTREALDPGGYCLYKNRAGAATDPLHNTLYIRLPAGQTLATVKLESIVARGGIHIGGSYVTIRGLRCEYGGTDGFSTTRNRGVVIEHVEARYYMDQGISHHGAEVVVRHGWFHHNAGGGIVDVYPEAKVRYENCLIEADTWRGGVEFHKGVFAMENCIIRANAAKALAVNKGARVTVRNCLLIGTADGQSLGVGMGDDSALTLESCTLIGFATGLRATVTAASRLELRRNAFFGCAINQRLVRLQPAGTPPVVLAERLAASGNVYTPGKFELQELSYSADGQRELREHRLEAAQHADFAALLGADRDAVLLPATDPPPAPGARPLGALGEAGATLTTLAEVGVRPPPPAP